MTPPVVVVPGPGPPRGMLVAMPGSDPKTDLLDYLRDSRAALLWKLEGLTEYDVRRPLVPTGTNLLGLVKHLATVEWGHFGAAFGRPYAQRLPWVDDPTEPHADLWATAEESREEIVELYRRVAAHSDTVLADLPLDAVGHVPWWPPEFHEVTLHWILVHTLAETQRHLGHADLVRELVDGSVGYNADEGAMTTQDPAWWAERRARLERVAREVQAGQAR